MQPHKSYVSTSGGQIHVAQHGSGDRLPIVMLHQTASSGKMYYAMMATMGYAGTIYALDTPGFGNSFDPPREALEPISQYARWLEEAIDALGIGQFHLVGHHTGACIGVEIATNWPDRVKSLTLMGPVPLTEEERDEFRQHYRTAIEPTADGSYLQQTWDYLKGLGAGSDLALHHREVLDTVRGYWGRFQVYTAVWDQDFVDHYKRVTAPMLLICAPDDVLMPFFSRAKEMRPDAKAVEVKGANFEPDQDTEGCSAALTGFLDEVDGL